MELSALFETCFVIIALMLVGFFGARRGIFPAGFSKAVSALIVNVFLVATIFRSIASGAAGIAAEDLPHVLLIICLAIALPYVPGRAALALFGKRYGADASLELSIAVMNNLLIGLPVLDAVYGPTAVLIAGLTSLPFNLLLYTYGVWRLEPGEKRRGGVRLKEIFSQDSLQIVTFTITEKGYSLVNGKGEELPAEERQVGFRNMMELSLSLI